jgi:hypothetical protein
VPQEEMRAEEWMINSSYLGNFNPGENTIRLDFNGTKAYVGGGYFRIDYTTSELTLYEGTGIERFYFPGIEGIINLYSSFYVPGTINTMDIYLHYLSDYDIFLNIGGQRIYSYDVGGEYEINITDDELKLTLNYSKLSKETVPIRVGLMATNFTQMTGTGGDVDVVLITDLSGSMDYRMDSEVTGVTRGCSDPSLYNSSTKRVSVAKCLDKEFVDAILGDPKNRVGLSAFYADDGPPYKARVYEEGLTNNASYLKGQIDAYSPQGGTCICCAINDAYEILDAQSNASRTKYIIVMSDGIPTHTCQAASGCEGTRTGLPGKEGLWLGMGAGCYGGLDDCSVNDCECASQNANWSSCRANNDLDATVHSIGFGPVADCVMANKTLRNVASCGGGEYYSSDNASELTKIYDYISEKILNISFQKQTAIVTVESAKFGNNISQGVFVVPDDVVVYDAKVTSYSADKWTDRALINSSGSWIPFYNLSDYGDDYQQLGDAYVVNIPVEHINTGENYVEISTGVSQFNSTGGSPDDKVIYTSGIDIEINYTGIFGFAEGCTWFVKFEDGTNTTVPIPSSYTGTDTCEFNEDTDCNSDYIDDAIDNAICHLFEQLDFDGDGLLFIKFGPTDLDIETVSIGKIPFMWGPTMVEVRVWK